MDLMEINYLLHHRLLIRFSYVQWLNTVTMLTTFFINILITWYFSYKLSRPANYNSDFTQGMLAEELDFEKFPLHPYMHNILIIHFFENLLLVLMWIITYIPLVNKNLFRKFG